MGPTVLSPPPALKRTAGSQVETRSGACFHPLISGSRVIEIPVGGARLVGTLAWPCHPSGFVVCLRTRGGRPAAQEERRLSLELLAEGLGTLLLDRPIGHGARNLELQAERVVAATEWLEEQPESAGLPVGCLDIGAGAAPGLAAASLSSRIGAVVCCEGRPDVLSQRLPLVLAPTLLIVGERDEEGLRLSYSVLARLGGRKWLMTIPGAGPGCDQSSALAEVGRRAAHWFVRYLTMEPAWQAAHATAG